MPPANSPAEAGSPTDRSRPETRPDTPASFRSALRELASPVPDYASTLTIQSEEDDVDAQNIHFLRTHLTSSEDNQRRPPTSSRDTGIPTNVPSLNLGYNYQRIENGAVPFARESLRRPPADAEITRRAMREIIASQQQQHERQQAEHAGLDWSTWLRSEPRIETSTQSIETMGMGEASEETMVDQVLAPYGDRIPNQQSLYDWAPATEEGEEEELEALLAELRRQQPNTHPEILRVLARADLEESRNLRARGSNGSLRPSSNGQQDTSLRSAAILQSVRRNWRFSTRSRMLMGRYVMERERATRDSEGASAQIPSTAPVEQPPRIQRGNSLHDLELMERAIRDNGSPTDPRLERIDALRRRYLDNPRPLENPTGKASEFERIIEYLHLPTQRDQEGSSKGIRHLPSGSSSLSRSHEHSEDRHRYLNKSRPSPSSWLTAGTSFTGHQHATPLVRTLYRLPNNQSVSSTTTEPHPSETYNMSQPWLAQHLTSTPLSLHSTPTTPGTPNAGPLPDRWTVKVAIHAVDYSTMSLQGTMEAYNVPSVTAYNSQSTNAASNLNQSQRNSRRLDSTTSSHSGPERTNESSNSNKTTFSTYLEGEIIDFSNHTLLTEPDSFAVKTSPTVDALYWRRLEPFAKLSDTEIARALLDPKWVEEKLMSRYILMRWKERCFVKPTFTSFSNATPAQQRSSSTAAPGTARAPPHQHQHQHQRQPSGNHSASDPPSAPPHPSAAAAAPDATFRPIPPPPDQSATTSFLSGADGNGYGLSISGFYYVSLRRADGRCEGLYYDPKSSPYQHLELKPTQATWGCGSWEFR